MEISSMQPLNVIPFNSGHTGRENKSSAVKILIVEDESSVAMVMKARLQSYGYTISAVVETGAAAIQKTESLYPDIVLMDVKLKGDMDGIEAAKVITTEFGLPVIFLTAYTDSHLLARAKKTEPFGYITKPYDGKELRIAIEIALYRHKIEQERKKLIDKLQKALAEVKKLSGLLPICASCKKIRDDKGYWNQLEAYIQEHSEAAFTHGVCPECSKRLYASLYKKQR